MVGEKFAWNTLKAGLELTDKDVEELKSGILSLKDAGPTYLKRAEATEKRVLAIAYFLKEQNPTLWAASELKAQQYFARHALVDDKKSKPSAVEQL
jgi:hypothetical protein